MLRCNEFVAFVGPDPGRHLAGVRIVVSNRHVVAYLIFLQLGDISTSIRTLDLEGKMTDRARFERYRLLVISTWPESELKQASLASARAALKREMMFAKEKKI